MKQQLFLLKTPILVINSAGIIKTPPTTSFRLDIKAPILVASRSRGRDPPPHNLLSTKPTGLLAIFLVENLGADRSIVFAQARSLRSTNHSMPSTGRTVVDDVLLSFLIFFCSFRIASGFQDWYFGVDKVPDFRMMAVKPVASVRDPILYTCSAAVSDVGKLAIRFHIDFRNLTEFCADGLKCRMPPITRSRTNVVSGPLVIYDSQLEFSSTVPMEGTVSCAFESSTGEVLAILYGFFSISRHILQEDSRISWFCKEETGCRWEETHCEVANHVNCSSCQPGMGFDSFYHLCFDPRQIGQSCVFQHQCQQSDRLSLCLQRKCECKTRHREHAEGCWPVVELGYLCGPRTICGTPHAECSEHACRCGKDHKPENGTCTVDLRIEVTHVLVIVMSTMIVFAAFTSLICILLRDKLPEDEDANRSRYSLNSIR
ncbi:uncharacterized protein LOC144153457 [Haemaphysalis longicornis]